MHLRWSMTKPTCTRAPGGRGGARMSCAPAPVNCTALATGRRNIPLVRRVAVEAARPGLTALPPVRTILAGKAARDAGAPPKEHVDLVRTPRPWISGAVLGACLGGLWLARGGLHAQQTLAPEP